jgi:tetratricopeptide (TPR) repeat protein
MSARRTRLVQRVGRAALLALWIVGLCLAPLVRADDSAAVMARARERYEQGARLYEQGQYLAAVRAFEEAFSLSLAKPLLFNIAQAYRLLGPGYCTQALSAYERYIAAEPFASNRDEVAERIGQMRGCVAEAERAREPAVQVKAVAAPSSAPRTDRREQPERGKQRVLALGLTLGGGLIALSGLSLYARARVEFEEQKDRCPCPEGKFERWERITRTSYALMGAGGGTVAGGLVWLGMLRSARYSLTVAPWYLRFKGRF